MAETEKIVIPIEVKETNAAALNKVQKGLADVNTQAGKSSISLGKLAGAVGLGMGAFQLASKAVQVLTDTLRDSITAAAEEETSLVRLGATIRSMGLSSSQSAPGVRKMAEALMAVTNIAHEELEGAAQVFMRMDSYDPANLEKMLKITADFAAGTGQNAATAAQQIATALETGQTRSLHFSAALRTQVQEMVKAGDSAGALALVMDTLNSKYGGQAAAQMNTYAGQIKTLQLNWGEFTANIGAVVIPGLTKLLKYINENNDSIWSHLKAWKAVEEEIPWVDKGERDLIETTKELAQASEDYANKLNNIVSFAKQYRNSQKDITEAQKELSAALASGDTTAIENAKNKLDEMKQAARDATNEMIAGFLQMRLAADGAFTEEDMMKVLKFRESVGLLSDEEYHAAVNALALADAIAALHDKSITITINTVETGGGSCFIPGTLVSMADGSYKAIERIQVGDEVISWDVNEWQPITAKVNEIQCHPKEETRGYILVNNQLGVTPEHMLYISDEWMPAGALHIGDKLVNAKGKDVIVTKLEWIGNPQSVYNLHTDQPAHNYFAGGVLVHNIKSEAGGGQFRGWAMVGDAPGGRSTPYTELVYAPHGAVVIPHGQMPFSEGVPAMAGGGVIPPIKTGGTNINIYGWIGTMESLASEIKRREALEELLS